MNEVEVVYNNLKEIQKQELDMLLELDRISKKHNLRYYLAYGTAIGAVRNQGFIPWDSDLDIVVETDTYDKLCKILNKELSSKYKINHVDFDKGYDSLKARISIYGEKHQTLHIDIFPMVGTPKGKLGKFFFRKICYLLYMIFFIKKVDLSSGSINRIYLANIIKLALLPIPSIVLIKTFSILSKLFKIEHSDVVYNICGSYGVKELIPKEYFGVPVEMNFEGHLLPLPKEWDKYLTHIYGDYMTPKKENYI